MKLIELFRLVEGAEVFTQTSAAYDVEFNGETYASHPLGRSAPEDKDKLERANLDLNMDIENPLAQRYLTQPVDNVVTLTIYRKEDDDEPYVYWKGRLATKKPGRAQFTMQFESVFTSMRRPGLRGRIQKACRHVLYGAKGCRLNPEDWRFDTSLISAEGVIVEVASVNGAADNTYRGGMIRASNGVLRFISKQIGTTLTLTRPFEVLNEAFEGDGPSGYGESYGELYGGAIPVTIYPGCAHNEAACVGFNNLPNYGGFSRLPMKNPVGGSSIM